MSKGATSDLHQRREVDGMRLALVRTELANRRTFLAYVKTSLGILAGGLALIHLVGDSPVMVLLGWCLLPVSVVVLGLGIRDFTRTRGIIRANEADSEV